MTYLIAIYLSVAIPVIPPEDVGFQDEREPSRTRYLLPEIKTNEAGVKCLNTQQWQRVILIAGEYQSLFNWRLEVETVLLRYVGLEEAFELHLRNLKEQVVALKDDRSYLHLRLDQSEKTIAKQRNSFKLDTALLVGTAIVAIIVVTVLSVKTASD